MAVDMTDPAAVLKFLQSKNAVANSVPAPQQAAPTPPSPTYGVPQPSPVPAPSYGAPAPPKDMSGFKSSLPTFGMPPAPASNPVPAPAPAVTQNASGGVSGTLSASQRQTYDSLPPEQRAAFLMSLGTSGGAAPPMPTGTAQPPKTAVGTYPATPNVPAPAGGAYPTMTPEQIRAEVADKIAAETAKRATAASQAKTGIQTSYDRLKATTNDTRTLENVQNARNLNPFSGRSDYAQGMIGREREISDRQQQEDLSTRLANIDVSLKDYLDATPEQQRAMENELTRQEREYALQVDQLGLQKAQLTGDYGGIRTIAGQTLDFNKGVTEAGLTGNYDPYSSQKQQMQSNSAAWANASPAERQRLAAENQRIGASIGAKQDANGDWIYPQGQQTIQGKAADAQSKLVEQQLANGQITNEVAQFQLNQLKDPNSPVNQAAQIDLELKQLDLANAPEEARLKIEQLKKQISQIGAAPYKSDIEKQLDQVRLDTAKQQLDQLKNGSSEEFDRGVEIFKTTGQMPAYMEKYGIDVKGLSSPQYAEDLSAMYEMLSSGQAQPQDLIKQIDDKVKIGAERPEDGERMKQAIYKLYPNLDPSSKPATTSSNPVNTVLNEDNMQTGLKRATALGIIGLSKLFGVGR